MLNVNRRKPSPPINFKTIHVYIIYNSSRVSPHYKKIYIMRHLFYRSIYFLYFRSSQMFNGFFFLEYRSSDTYMYMYNTPKYLHYYFTQRDKLSCSSRYYVPVESVLSFTYTTAHSRSLPLLLHKCARITCPQIYL